MLTPETIASRRFDKQMGGYKQDEVEAFLQQVAAEYARVLREKEELEQKMDVLAEKVEQYREDEDSLRSALQCSLRQRKIVAGQCSYDGKSVICEHFCIIHSVIPFLSRSEGGVLVPPPAVCRGRP